MGKNARRIRKEESVFYPQYTGAKKSAWRKASKEADKIAHSADRQRFLDTEYKRIFG
jgi:hypothetical protein